MGMSELLQEKPTAATGTAMGMASLVGDAPSRAGIPARIAGLRTLGILSKHPIHYGTHSEPGTFDIGGNDIKRNKMTLEQAAAKLTNEGYAVAIRRKGQNKITNDHLHVVDPDKSPKEYGRLIKQGAIYNPPGDALSFTAKMKQPTAGEKKAVAAVARPDVLANAVKRQAGRALPEPKPSPFGLSELDKTPTRFEQVQAENARQNAIREQPNPLAEVPIPWGRGMQKAAQAINAPLAYVSEATGDIAGNVVRQLEQGQMPTGSPGSEGYLPHEQSWAEKTARNAGGLAPIALGAVLNPMVGTGMMLSQAPALAVPDDEGKTGAEQMAQDVGRRFRHPITAIKEGELPNLLFDVAMVVGLGLHGLKAAKSPVVQRAAARMQAGKATKADIRILTKLAYDPDIQAALPPPREAATVPIGDTGVHTIPQPQRALPARGVRVENGRVTAEPVAVDAPGVKAEPVLQTEAIEPTPVIVNANGAATQWVYPNDIEISRRGRGVKNGKRVSGFDYEVSGPGIPPAKFPSLAAAKKYVASRPPPQVTAPNVLEGTTTGDRNYGTISLSGRPRGKRAKVDTSSDTLTLTVRTPSGKLGAGSKIIAQESFPNNNEGFAALRAAAQKHGYEISSQEYSDVPPPSAGAPQEAGVEKPSPPAVASEPVAGEAAYAEAVNTHKIKVMPTGKQRNSGGAMNPVYRDEYVATQGGKKYEFTSDNPHEANRAALLRFAPDTYAQLEGIVPEAQPSPPPAPAEGASAHPSGRYLTTPEGRKAVKEARAELAAIINDKSLPPRERADAIEAAKAKVDQLVTDDNVAGHQRLRSKSTIENVVDESPTDVPETNIAVGDIVRFQEPNPGGTIGTRAGTVTLIKPDGTLEIRAQQGGYYTKSPSEVQARPVEGWSAPSPPPAPKPAEAGKPKSSVNTMTAEAAFDAISHAKGVIASAELGGLHLVGKKNFIEAVRTLQKEGVIPRDVKATDLSAERAGQWVRQASSPKSSVPKADLDAAFDVFRKVKDAEQGSTAPGGSDLPTATELAKAAHTIGKHYYETGVTTLKEWTQAVVDAVGEHIRPYLDDAWKALHGKVADEGGAIFGPKNASTQVDRDFMGLPPAIRDAYAGDKATVVEAERLLKSGERDPLAVAERLTAGETSVAKLAQDEAIVSVHGAKLKVKLEKLYAEEESLSQTGQPTQAVREQIGEAELALAKITEALQSIGTPTSHGLSIRKVLLKRDMSLVGVLQRARLNRGELKPGEVARLKAAQKKAVALQEQLDAMESEHQAILDKLAEAERARPVNRRTIEPTDSHYMESNTIVTKARFAEIEARLAEKYATQRGSGPDTEYITLTAEWITAHLEASARWTYDKLAAAYHQQFPAAPKELFDAAWQQRTNEKRLAAVNKRLDAELERLEAGETKTKAPGVILDAATRAKQDKVAQARKLAAELKKRTAAPRSEAEVAAAQERRTIANLQRRLDKLLGLIERKEPKPKRAQRPPDTSAIIAKREQVEHAEVVLDKLTGPRKTPTQIVGNSIADTFNFLKSTLFSVDIGSAGRQTWGLVGEPKEWWRGLKSGLKVYGAEVVGRRSVTEAEMNAVHNHPLYPVAQRYVRFVKTGPLSELAQRSDQAMNRGPARVPGLGRLYRASEASFAQNINLVMMDTFAKYVKAEGPTVTPQRLEALGKIVSSLSGRGGLGPAESAGMIKALNVFVSSPRYTAGLFQSWAGLASHDPLVRKVAAKNMVASVGIGLSVVAMAAAAKHKNPDSQIDGTIDPLDSDFGKVVVGNTRIDLLRGQGQLVRAVMQTITGTRRRDGKTTSTRDRWQPLQSFFTNKSSPGVTLASDMATNYTRDYEPFYGHSPAYYIGRVAEPLAARDIREAWQDGGWGRGLFVAPFAIGGAGVMTYKDSGPTLTPAQQRVKDRAEKYANSPAVQRARERAKKRAERIRARTN